MPAGVMLLVLLIYSASWADVLPTDHTLPDHMLTNHMLPNACMYHYPTFRTRYEGRRAADIIIRPGAGGVHGALFHGGDRGVPAQDRAVRQPRADAAGRQEVYGRGRANGVGGGA